LATGPRSRDVEQPRLFGVSEFLLLAGELDPAGRLGEDHWRSPSARVAVNRHVTAHAVAGTVDVQVHLMLKLTVRIGQKDDWGFESFRFVQVHHAYGGYGRQRGHAIVLFDLFEFDELAEIGH